MAIRIVVALAVLAISLPVPVLRVTHQRVVRETTLLGGRWKVGENGVTAFLVLWGLTRLLMFPLAPMAVVLGLVKAEIGGPVVLGAALSWVLLGIVDRPRNIVFHLTAFFMTSVFIALILGLLIVMEWPLPVAGLVAGFMPFIVVAIVVGVILALTWLERWRRHSDY